MHFNFLKRQSGKRIVIYTYDVCMIFLAWMSAYILRFDIDTMNYEILDEAMNVMPIVVLIQSISFLVFGLYRGVWRFASTPDLVRIFKSVVVGVGFCVFFLFIFSRLEDIPRSIFPIYSVFLVMYLGGSRFAYRLLKEFSASSVSQRVLVVGAGYSGESIIRDMKKESIRNYKPVIIVDDRKSKIGRDIHGVRVVDNSRAIPALCEKYKIDLIFIAIPSAKASSMRRILGYCQRTKLPIRTLPSLNDLASGSVDIKALREVSLLDLLSRDQVLHDWSNITKTLSGKSILITGGCGSIGSELFRQLAAFDVSNLIVIEHSEQKIYQFEKEIKERFPEVNFKLYLASILDAVAVNDIIARHKPDVIFHAAAYKHVPILEDKVRAAITNNILGTKIVADAAIKAGVSEFVMISTDKAVNPHNVMGASKRAAELMCQSLYQGAKTKVTIVRFGNVLGSDGSVVPHFKDQIISGGPVTVTHPDITRYFMTIAEACQLIIQAATISEGGQIFVLDMGEPISILYLANQMIKMSGKDDITVAFTGLRPGEKLTEELFFDYEKIEKTTHEKLSLAKAKIVNKDTMQDFMASFESAAEKADTKALTRTLLKMVPEYKNEEDATITIETEQEISDVMLDT